MNYYSSQMNSPGNGLNHGRVGSQNGTGSGRTDSRTNRPVVPLPNPGEGGPINGGNGGNGSGQPAIPLPNPGEGGPVNGGNGSGQPAILLPNPGEGGPVNDGTTSGQPAIPLPNPGEGGPVNGGNGSGQPVILLPNPGEGGPVNDGTTSGQPAIPLPNPGEGGPVYPGPVITVPVRPVLPCFFCNSNSFGTMRFLNAATGYSAFVVSIRNEVVVNGLEYAELSEYGRVSTGYQTVTISAQNGYVYISKQVRIMVGSEITAAIVNTVGGLDLVLISDEACNTVLNASCIRVCNLSFNSGPLDVSTGNNQIIFRNIAFMDVTEYRRISPGTYVFQISNNSGALVWTEIKVAANAQYTIYVFNWNPSPNAIRTLMVEDRK